MRGKNPSEFIFSRIRMMMANVGLGALFANWALPSYFGIKFARLIEFIFSYYVYTQIHRDRIYLFSNYSCFTSDLRPFLLPFRGQ